MSYFCHNMCSVQHFLCLNILYLQVFTKKSGSEHMVMHVNEGRHFRSASMPARYIIGFYGSFYRENLCFINYLHWLKHSKLSVARPLPLFGVACFLSLPNPDVVLTFDCIIQAHFPANNTQGGVDMFIWPLLYDVIN